MKLIVSSCTALALGLIISQAVQAESLAKMEKWKKINTKVGEYATKANTACGTNWEMKLDKGSFKTDEDLDNVDTFAWSAFEGLENVCLKGDDHKKAVAGKIKGISFAKGPKNSYALKGTSFNFASDLGKSNNAAGVRDEVTEWFMKLD